MQALQAPAPSALWPGVEALCRVSQPMQGVTAPCRVLVQGVAACVGCRSRVSQPHAGCHSPTQGVAAHAGYHSPMQGVTASCRVSQPTQGVAVHAGVPGGHCGAAGPPAQAWALAPGAAQLGPRPQPGEGLVHEAPFSGAPPAHPRAPSQLPCSLGRTSSPGWWGRRRRRCRCRCRC